MNLISVLVYIIRLVMGLLYILILAHIFLSYFMSPYHPVRERIDRLVVPFLAPIRRIIPAVGNIDFSPLILIIIVQLLGTILINLVLSIPK